MRTLFRPCIDLHQGQVKQIVGGTLSDSSAGLQTNFVSAKPSAEYAELYRKHGLEGGHVIMLGPGNETATKEALQAWPNRLQVGGGINDTNASEWIERGAAKVIVTSYLFPSGKFSQQRLEALAEQVGRERVVVDLSCRRRSEGGWVVAMDRWQRLTDMVVDEQTLKKLAEFCSEFLVHAADVEGLCGGIDRELVECLGKWSPLPVTYAGGASSVDDLDLVNRLSRGRVDLTIGSALDIFGGSMVRFDDCVAWNR
ncbi:Enzyme that catalyzes the fourth step in the histidine pathway [Coemansia guatemalensis]|uniref:1-(5-phosphoribosyl)-5-[(5-phosphoribosylamino)methylideneamino] imidazole-4-carboxamide isomerase n=1 Tax=Coemansia guatemalensis TaxID=2761395 RepID=A0A9W8HRA9_9FUNG|nr:Enzyme that catalyzes the fourth step in the histidine pathway [Coemansia guatemalensis]